MKLNPGGRPGGEVKFLIGLLLSAVGLWLFFDSVRIQTGYGGLFSGMMHGRGGGGRGGMGEVWKAEHRMLARAAAIKLIRLEALGGDADTRQIALARFEREAQATASLRSPHTIELYDFGVATDGAFFYVMELLDGLDLEQLVVRFGPVPPERAWRSPVWTRTGVCVSRWRNSGE